MVRDYIYNIERLRAEIRSKERRIMYLLTTAAPPASTTVPISAASHTDDPEVCATVLFLHSMQSVSFVLPIVFEALPGGQALQFDLDEAPSAVEYIPAGHWLHSFSASKPLTMPYLPA